MVNCGSLLKSVLLTVVLVVVSASGSTEEKVAPCCTKVDKNEINEPILKVWVQPAVPPCVNAVIFQTDSGLFCKYLKAPWVRNKIRELRKAKAKSSTPSVVSASPLSLLSSITSTSSPPSSSPLLRSPQKAQTSRPASSPPPADED